MFVRCSSWSLIGQGCSSSLLVARRVVFCLVSCLPFVAACSVSYEVGELVGVRDLHQACGFWLIVKLYLS